MLSSWDDYPVHQIADVVRHVGTSDRNFYDRYYFNLHGSSDELFMVMGLGQYPNLGVTDAFAQITHAGRHRVVRASKPLEDRRDTSVGPIRVEVVEPLHKVRFIVEPTEHPFACDVTWTGEHPVHEEPRQFIRRHGRVLFDTMRFAQTGRWEGHLDVAGTTIAVTADRFGGTRDRSWGVRPHGEPEPAGIQTGGSMQGMWNYSPMQFPGFSILYMLNEHDDGHREIEEAVRLWHDPTKGSEHLGRPEYEHVLRSGTRVVEHSTIHFPDAPGGGFSIDVTPLTTAYIAIGTGYGLDADWKHGMFQGPDLVVQYREWPVEEVAGLGQYGVVDHVARFETTDGIVGYGLHEHAFIGPFNRYGMPDGGSLAP